MALKAMIVQLIFALVSVNFSLSARIAGFSPTYSGSHYFTIKKVMEELSARGHEVVLVRPVLRDAPPSNEQKIPQRTFLTPYDEKDIENKVKTAMEGKLWKTINNLYEMQRVNCEYMLNDTVLLQELKSFDLIVYESISFCAVLVSELLGIPKVIIFSGPPNGPGTFAHNVPHPVSYIPAPMTLFTSEMTFLQRLVNFGAYNFIQSAEQVLIARYMGSLKEEYNITPGKSYQEASGTAELVLFLADFALEYPQPLLPGQIMVGAISAKADPETLPPELKDFIDSAGGHGFVIASFGSYAQTIIAKEKIDVLAEAFGKVKQKVIWKLKGYIPSSLNQNIRVMSWIPQSDLLAHKDIKAFVSHVGHNSLYESAYHGVPVVAVPLCTDQFSNARKAEHFGLAKVLDHKTMNAEELSEAIQHVIDEPRFKREAKRISRLMKDNPRTPLEKAGDWIEYVHRHGGAQHLRAQVFNIPWFQYFLLDVIAFLVAIVTLVVMVIRYTCRCLCKACGKNGVTKTKKD